MQLQQRHTGDNLPLAFFEEAAAVLRNFGLNLLESAGNHGNRIRSTSSGGGISSSRLSGGFSNNSNIAADMPDLLCRLVEARRRLLVCLYRQAYRRSIMIRGLVLYTVVASLGSPGLLLSYSMIT